MLCEEGMPCPDEYGALEDVATDFIWGGVMGSIVSP